MSNTAAQVFALFGAGVASFLAPCPAPLPPAFLGIPVAALVDPVDPPPAAHATLLWVPTSLRRGWRRSPDGPTFRAKCWRLMTWRL